MKNLLYKEFKLAMHPAVYAFWLLSIMVLIPNYPYYVILFYSMLGIFFVCLNGRENHDIYYSLSLPIKKSDLVKARFALVVLIEMVQLLLTIPFIILKPSIYADGNQVGMDANIAFVALSLVIYGIINWTFLKNYYKCPEKVGRVFVFSTVYVFLLIAVFETLTHILPFFRDKLDTADPQFLMEKLILLVVGIVIYIVLTMLSMRKSIKVFEELDF